MATIAREVERKYDVTGTAVPDLGAVPGVASESAPAEEVLDAVYYDTQDLRLITAGITLRQRTGGADAGWHLKLPAGPDARDEIGLPLGEPGGPVPEELAGLVRARTRGAALLPVVRIRTVRGRRRLLDDAGRGLADIAADEVSAELMDGSGTTSWHEMEVELGAGDRALLEEVDRRLLAAGARPAPTATKLARALGERLGAAQRRGRHVAGEPADRERALTAHSSAGQVVLAYLETQVNAIIHYDPLVRRDQPDAVHQMRVATRRARSALQAFGEIVDRGRTRPLGAELKWLATVLGRARDGEVLLARMTNQLAAIPAELVAGPVKQRIAGHFSSELSQARAAVLDELDGPRYVALLDALDDLLDRPPLTPLAAGPGGEVLREPVRRASRRLKRAIKRIPDQDTIPGQDKDAAIHQARKAAKRARYAAEAARPALGRRAARQAAETKALQTLLGDHHDSVVARSLLRDLAGQAYAAGEDSFTYGVMYAREACAASEIERSLATRRGTVNRR